MSTLLIGSDNNDTRDFATTLNAELLALPGVCDAPGWEWAAELEAWRDRE